MMTETAFTDIGRWFVANRGMAMSLIVPGQQAGSANLQAPVVLLDRARGDWRPPGFAAAAAFRLVGLPANVPLRRGERGPRPHEAGVGGERGVEGSRGVGSGVAQ